MTLARPHIFLFLSVFMLAFMNTSATPAAASMNTIDFLEKNCPQLKCAFIGTQKLDLNENSIQKLQALELADSIRTEVWPDTLLEGDVEALETEPTRLESVETVFTEQAVFAYRISYSVRAIDKSNCRDFNNPETCQRGKLFQQALVSLDFKSYKTIYSRNSFIRDNY